MNSTAFIGGAASSQREGLVAYYGFDGNADDDSGSGNNEVVHGAVLMEDRYNNPNGCYNFTGSSYIEVAKGNDLKFELNMSISLWLRPSMTQQSYVRGLDKGSFNGASNAAGWVRQNAANTNQYTSIMITVGGLQNPPALSIKANEWSYVTIIREDAMVSTYLNAVYQFSSSPILSTAGDQPLMIGGLNKGYTNPASEVELFYTGQIDELYIYNRSISIGYDAIRFKGANAFSDFAPEWDIKAIPDIRVHSRCFGNFFFPVI